MPKVLVRNKNEYPYEEKFKGKVVMIGAGQAIEMDSDDAKRFLASCNGIRRDADGQPLPEFRKRLFIESLTGGEVADPKAKTAFVSNIDGREFGSKAELDEHLAQFKDKNVTDENAEREMAQRKAPAQRRSKPGAA